MKPRSFPFTFHIENRQGWDYLLDLGLHAGRRNEAEAGLYIRRLRLKTHRSVSIIQSDALTIMRTNCDNNCYAHF